MACERESHLETRREVEAACVTPRAAACVVPVFWDCWGMVCPVLAPRRGVCVTGLGAAGICWWVNWDLLP